MKLQFEKFQGNGNDFVIIDNREGNISLSPEKIRKLCNRHFGIGADGLMFLNSSLTYDFEMEYFNSDGNLSSMCGNGGRCLAAFAFLRGIIKGNKMIFTAFDGLHEAEILQEIVPGKSCDVSLEMMDVSEVQSNGKYYFLDTGSPHYVEFVDKVAEIDVLSAGRKTRFAEAFAPEGTNVNFVEISDNRIFVRTYERGVEEETLSCGTGVTASAISAFLETGKSNFDIHTTGGEFRVMFKEENGVFKSVRLIGPAEMVFKGTISFD